MKGTGRIYQRGSVWWVDYSFRGKRYRESVESEKKGDATKLLRKRMAEMGQGRVVGPDAEKVTIADLSQMLTDDYAANGRRTLERAQSAMKNLERFFNPERRALDITTDRVNAYIALRLQEGSAPATIRREVATLKRMFTLAVQVNRLPQAPHIPRIEVDNAREGFFAPADLEAIVAELPEPLGPVVRFAALTGWRRGEILPLTWSQVDFNHKVVRLAPGTTKNRKGQEFPFGTFPPLASLLESQREQTRTVERERGEIIPWVFHRNGERIQSLRTAWDAAGQARRHGRRPVPRPATHRGGQSGEGWRAPLGRDEAHGAQDRERLQTLRDRRPAGTGGGSGEARAASRRAAGRAEHPTAPAAGFRRMITSLFFSPVAQIQHNPGPMTYEGPRFSEENLGPEGLASLDLMLQRRRRDSNPHALARAAFRVRR